jgi:hypothetical protein
MSKYYLLRHHLLGVRSDRWRPTFREIEAVIGFSLPASARTYAAWWSNGSGMPQSAVWLDAGWRTEELDLGAERVTFRRDGPPNTEDGTKPAKRKAPERGGPYAWDVPEILELRLAMAWTPIGRVTAGADGPLVFPAAPASPGLYRFRVRAAGRDAVYIGETDNLARRFTHYRNPGPTQPTNLRLNAKFAEALTAGAEIAVATITEDAWIERGGHRKAAQLSSKP